MKRQLCILAIVSAVLVATAPVAVVHASHATVTASSHTTDTDFNAGTLTGDVSVSGTGSSASIQLQSVGYDISGATVTNEVSLEVDGSPAFADDGNKLYLPVFNVSGKFIRQYSLTNPYSLSPSPTLEKVVNITSDTSSSAASVQLNESGDIMYVGNYDGELLEYSLSTEYDVSTASFTSKTDLSGADNVKGIEIKPDGSKLYTIGQDGPDGTVKSYDLSAAYDSSTATQNNSHFVGFNDAGLAFNPSGSIFVIFDDGESQYSRFDLSTPWDITTASLTETSSISDSVNGDGVELNPSGSVMIGNDGIGGPLEEYDTSTVASGSYLSANHSATNTDQGWTNLTVPSGTMTVTWEGFDGSSWSQLSTDSYTTTGNKTQTWTEFDGDKVRVNVTFDADAQELHDEGVQFTAADTTVDNGSATPTGDLTTDTPTLEIDVEDADFDLAQGDSVDVEFFVDGSSIGTDTITSNGTASATVSSPLTGGDHTWNATATDSYGHSVTSQDFTVSVPDVLSIRNESEPHGLITETVEVTFFEEVDDSPSIIQRTTSDGTVSLTGLPVGTTFVVTVTGADNYTDRQVVLESIFDQETVFLLHDDVTSVDNRFEVNDRTGDFSGSTTEITIQKAINRSEYGGSPSGFSWSTIAGDNLGSDQAVQFELERDERYRIIVENDDNDRRVLGSYTAKQTGTIEFDIGQVVADPTGPDQVTAEAEWVNDTGTPTVEFDYNDSFDGTNTLWVHIFERGNESNELLANTSFSGPLGSQSISEIVPAADAEAEWVVKFVAERDGENAQGRFVVGPQRTILDELPTWVKTIISIGTLVVVAGLFSQLNGDVGALVVAGLGAMFWFVGFLPPEVSDGVVVLALITAGVIFIRERRGGGTGL